MATNIWDSIGLDPETLATLKTMNQPSVEDQRTARNNALMSAGFGMMMNNQGGNRSQAFMNALGAGGMAGLGAYQNTLDDARTRNIEPLKLAMSMRKLTKENLPSGMTIGPDGKPVWIEGYLEGQQKLHQSQAQPYFSPLSTPNGVLSFDSRTGKAAPLDMNGGPVMKAADDPVHQGNIAGAKKSGTVRAEAETTAQIELPAYLAQAEQGIKQIDELLAHPGFKTAVGKSSMFQVQKIPGTDAYDFMNRLDQVKGGSFLEAFKQLKGGGQITEIEGEKGTQAINRMNNSSSEQEFVSAANDLKSIIKSGLDRAKVKAMLTGPNQVVYPPSAGKPGVKVPDGTESSNVVLSNELAVEQANLAAARASGDLKGISQANRNIALLNQELGVKSAPAADVPKVRRYNPQTGRIE